MEALYLLIPLSVLVVFVALWIFFKAADSGQFDDLVGPGMRILHFAFGDNADISAGVSGPAPLNGTCTSFVPVIRLNSSPFMWCVVP